jgi:hypothetical protein
MIELTMAKNISKQKIALITGVTGQDGSYCSWH